MLEQLGKYRIDSVLGKGAMGTVYKAFDPHIARVVALKTIRRELLGDAQQHQLLSRFQNEAQAAGRLSHPNIVAVYDYGEDDGAAYSTPACRTRSRASWPRCWAGCANCSAPCTTPTQRAWCTAT